MELGVTQNKKGIMINVDTNVKNQIIGVPVKIIVFESQYTGRDCDRTCKYDEYLDFKNCSCEKCFFNKLVVAGRDQILYITTAATIVNKKAMNEKLIAFFTLFHYQLYVCYYQFLFLLIVTTIIQNIG